MQKATDLQEKIENAKGGPIYNHKFGLALYPNLYRAFNRGLVAVDHDDRTSKLKKSNMILVSIIHLFLK
jgi:hypothetical protein